MDILATGLSGLNASRHRALTNANNIANMNTPGFKAQRVDSATGPQGRSVQTDRVSINQELGSLIPTQNPMDLAISGKGYFQVADQDGNLFYTRDGSFRQDSQGRLATSQGLVVQPETVIPQGAENVRISSEGIVSARLNGETKELGQVELSNFSNEQGLAREGNNLLLPSGASGIPQAGRPGVEGRGYLISGFLEGSNVDIAREMINLRTEENITKANAAVIKTAAEMQEEILKI
jgi:flagellar basal-body rod protein FlgG